MFLVRCFQVTKQIPRSCTHVSNATLMLKTHKQQKCIKVETLWMKSSEGGQRDLPVNFSSLPPPLARYTRQYKETDMEQETDRLKNH